MIDKAVKIIVVGLFIGALLALGLMVHADNVRTVSVLRSLSVVGVTDRLSSNGYDVGRGIRYHQISWEKYGVPSLTACSIAVEKSADGVTWTDLLGRIPCTTNATSVVVADQAPLLRLNLVQFVATPASISVDLLVTYAGWQDDPRPGATALASTSTTTTTTTTTTLP